MAKKTPKAPAADDDVLNGGPGEGGDPAEAERRAAAGDEGEGGDNGQPQRKKLKIGGKDFEVEATLADAIEAMNAGFTHQVAELKAAIPKAPAKGARAEDDGAGADGDPLADLETEIFRNPRAALEKFGKTIRKQVTDELTAAYGRDRASDAEKDFWRGFYEANDDLDRKTDHALVNAVLDQNMEEFKTIKDPEKLAEALGEKTRQSILALSRRAKTAKRPRAEAADGTGTGGRAAGDDDAETGSRGSENVVSLAEELRTRRRAKRNPSLKTGAA